MWPYQIGRVTRIGRSNKDIAISVYFTVRTLRGPWGDGNEMIFCSALIVGIAQADRMDHVRLMSTWGFREPPKIDELVVIGIDPDYVPEPGHHRRASCWYPLVDYRGADAFRARVLQTVRYHENPPLAMFFRADGSGRPVYYPVPTDATPREVEDLTILSNRSPILQKRGTETQLLTSSQLRANENLELISEWDECVVGVLPTESPDGIYWWDGSAWVLCAIRSSTLNPNYTIAGLFTVDGGHPVSPASAKSHTPFRQVIVATCDGLTNVPWPKRIA